MSSQKGLRKSNKILMRFFYKVCKRRIMGTNPKQILGGTQKLGKVLKEKTVSPIELKNLRIEPKWVCKKKIDNLEGEFKKIKPTSFDEE